MISGGCFQPSSSMLQLGLSSRILPLIVATATYPQGGVFGAHLWHNLTKGNFPWPYRGEFMPPKVHNWVLAFLWPYRGEFMSQNVHNWAPAFYAIAFHDLILFLQNLCSLAFLRWAPHLFVVRDMLHVAARAS